MLNPNLTLDLLPPKLQDVSLLDNGCQFSSPIPVVANGGSDMCIAASSVVLVLAHMS